MAIGKFSSQLIKPKTVILTRTQRLLQQSKSKAVPIQQPVTVQVSDPEYERQKRLYEDALGEYNENVQADRMAYKLYINATKYSKNPYISSQTPLVQKYYYYYQNKDESKRLNELFKKQQTMEDYEREYKRLDIEQKKLVISPQQQKVYQKQQEDKLKSMPMAETTKVGEITVLKEKEGYQGITTKEGMTYQSLKTGYIIPFYNLTPQEQAKRDLLIRTGYIKPEESPTKFMIFPPLEKPEPVTELSQATGSPYIIRNFPEYIDPKSKIKAGIYHYAFSEQGLDELINTNLFMPQIPVIPVTNEQGKVIGLKRPEFNIGLGTARNYLATRKGNWGLPARVTAELLPKNLVEFGLMAGTGGYFRYIPKKFAVPLVTVGTGINIKQALDPSTTIEKKWASILIASTGVAYLTQTGVTSYRNFKLASYDRQAVKVLESGKKINVKEVPKNVKEMFYDENALKLKYGKEVYILNDKLLSKRVLESGKVYDINKLPSKVRAKVINELGLNNGLVFESQGKVYIFTENVLKGKRMFSDISLKRTLLIDGQPFDIASSGTTKRSGSNILEGGDLLIRKIVNYRPKSIGSGLLESGKKIRYLTAKDLQGVFFYDGKPYSVIPTKPRPGIFESGLKSKDVNLKGKIFFYKDKGNQAWDIPTEETASKNNQVLMNRIKTQIQKSLKTETPLKLDTPDLDLRLTRESPYAGTGQYERTMTVLENIFHKPHPPMAIQVQGGGNPSDPFGNFNLGSNFFEKNLGSTGGTGFSSVDTNRFDSLGVLSGRGFGDINLEYPMPRASDSTDQFPKNLHKISTVQKDVLIEKNIIEEITKQDKSSKNKNKSRQLSDQFLGEELITDQVTRQQQQVPNDLIKRRLRNYIKKPVWSPEQRFKLFKRIKTKKYKTVALFPDFTARAIGLQPKQVTMKESLKELNKIQTGFEVRRGLRLKKYSPIDEKSLIKGVMN